MKSVPKAFHNLHYMPQLGNALAICSRSILNRNPSVIGKSLDERYLPVGEQPDLQTVSHHYTQEVIAF